MPLIKTVSVDEAQGTIKQMYDVMLAKASMVPKPLQMMSASPGLFEIQSRTMGYFMEHPNLGFLLLAHIRLLVAFNHEYPYCIELNSGLVQQAQGLTDDELAALRSDPTLARLDAKDKAMLLFVVRATMSPEEVGADDVEGLRDLGWSDADVYDAVSYGAQMVSSGILFNTFKMADV